MTSAFSLADILFHPIAVAAAFVVLAAAATLFAVKRKTLSSAQKAVCIILCIICAAYLGFVLWTSIGFGSAHPAHDPVPYPAAAGQDGFLRAKNGFPPRISCVFRLCVL